MDTLGGPSIRWADQSPVGCAAIVTAKQQNILCFRLMEVPGETGCEGDVFGYFKCIGARFRLTGFGIRA